MPQLKSFFIPAVLTFNSFTHFLSLSPLSPTQNHFSAVIHTNNCNERFTWNLLNYTFFFHFISFLQQKSMELLLKHLFIQQNSAECFDKMLNLLTQSAIAIWMWENKYYHCVRWDSLPTELCSFFFNDWFIFEFSHIRRFHFSDFFVAHPPLNHFDSSINLSIQMRLLVWLFEHFIYIFFCFDQVFRVIKVRTPDSEMRKVCELSVFKG